MFRVSSEETGKEVKCRTGLHDHRMMAPVSSPGSLSQRPRPAAARHGPIRDSVNWAVEILY
eukprot:160177-Hanusia_phi.AAC.2